MLSYSIKKSRYEKHNSESQETRNSHIEGDNNDIWKLKGSFTSTINLFEEDIAQSKLFNAKTDFTVTKEKIW